MSTSRKSLIAAGCAASFGLALSLAAPAASAQNIGGVDLGSIGATSVGIAAKTGMGGAVGSLPGQCSALGSAVIGHQNMTRAVPGENSGQTVFLVDQSLPSEASMRTENIVIHWRNLDTGAQGTRSGYDEINWVNFHGVDVWGAIVDTGPGTIEWTMDATEDGLFLPTFSLDVMHVPTGSMSRPYAGCGGSVVVP